MSTKTIRNSEDFLKLFSKSKPKRRQLLVQNATREELKSICEICLNILKGNIPVDGKNLKKLKRKKQVIRELGGRTASIAKKRKIANQNGGFLGTVASLALPFIAQLLLKR